MGFFPLIWLTELPIKQLHKENAALRSTCSYRLFFLAGVCTSGWWTMEIAYWAQEQQTTFASPAWADGVSAQEEVHSDSLAYTWTQSPIKKKRFK